MSRLVLLLLVVYLAGCSTRNVQGDVRAKVLRLVEGRLHHGGPEPPQVPVWQRSRVPQLAGATIARRRGGSSRPSPMQPGPCSPWTTSILGASSGTATPGPAGEKVAPLPCQVIAPTRVAALADPGLDEANVRKEDARFMVVTCSAVVNFLIMKAEAAGLLKLR